MSTLAEWVSGRYSLTVVYFAGAPTDSHTAVSHAAEAIRDKGKVTYFAFDSLDGIPGQMITTTQSDERKFRRASISSTSACTSPKEA